MAISGWIKKKRETISFLLNYCTVPQHRCCSGKGTKTKLCGKINSGKTKLLNPSIPSGAIFQDYFPFGNTATATATSASGTF